jgi:hypothetical protein
VFPPPTDIQALSVTDDGMGSFTFSYEILNADAGMFYLGLYESDNATLDPSDTLLTRQSASSTWVGTYSTSLWASPCRPFVIAVVDYGNFVIEADETNNQARSAPAAPAGSTGSDARTRAPGSSPDTSSGSGGSWGGLPIVTITATDSYDDDVTGHL